MRLPRSMHDQIIAQARRDLPNETGGLIATDKINGTAQRLYPILNIKPSPAFYHMDPMGYMQARLDAEDNGWIIGGYYHTHPFGSAHPSGVDTNVSQFSDLVWLIATLGVRWRRSQWSTVSEIEEPHINAWRIEDRRPYPVALEVFEDELVRT